LSIASSSSSSDRGEIPSARNPVGSLRPWIGEIDRAVGFHRQHRLGG
jgi:hypothetical protein